MKIVGNGCRFGRCGFIYKLFRCCGGLGDMSGFCSVITAALACEFDVADGLSAGRWWNFFQNSYQPLQYLRAARLFPNS